MAQDREWYEEQLRQKAAQLKEQQSMRASYMAMAREIGEAYDRVARCKAAAKEKRNALKSFSQKKYGSFKGNLYTKSYLGKMSPLLDSYDQLVERMDRNLDALNDARRRYENRAYECDGMIGLLERGINTLYRSMQNLVN